VIRFPCPTCHRAYELGDEHAGRVYACRECRGTLTVPQPSPSWNSRQFYAGLGMASFILGMLVAGLATVTLIAITMSKPRTEAMSIEVDRDVGRHMPVSMSYEEFAMSSGLGELADPVRRNRPGSKRKVGMGRGEIAMISLCLAGCGIAAVGLIAHICLRRRTEPVAPATD